MKRSPRRPLIGAGLAALVLIGLAACAGTPPTPVAVVPAREGAPLPSAAFQVAGSVPEAQLPAVLSAFNGQLKARLVDAAGIWRLQPERDSATRVVLVADRAFESGSAQLKAELLLPLSELALAVRGGAWVIHVIGHAERAEDLSLAERRAMAVASYLAGQGLPGGRLRAEARSDQPGAGHRIELVFAAIVEGRELRAWMPPEALAAKR